MGTRADFYVGFGEQAEWLGSIGWDGYPEGIEPKIKDATTEETYRKEVAAFIEESEGTKPEMGWPWPWDDSHLSDYAYTFAHGVTWVTDSRGPWWAAAGPKPIHLKPGEEFRPDYHGTGEPDEEKHIVRVEKEISCPNCNYTTVPGIVFPNMKDIKKVALGKRSGLMILEV